MVTLQAFLAQVPTPVVSKWYGITAWSLIGVALLAFLLTAWRDVYHIFFRAKDMGTGLARIWAVARTAIFESWAARIWIVPILWLSSVLIINSLVIPYKDANDTISLYTSICLYGQMFMVLLALMVLASFSFGRERERRTIITTGSKPLSRLEFFLGKIVGFSTVGLALLVFMGFVTYGYLLVAEQRVRSNARAQYEVDSKDYEAAQHSAATNPAEASSVLPPKQSDLNIANSGVLMARNYIAAQEFQIAGLIAHSNSPNDPDHRLIKGSGGERMLLRFPTIYTRGLTPKYYFRFVAYKLKEAARENDPNALEVPPSDQIIELKVIISAATGVVQERYLDSTVQLTESTEYRGLYEATFAPEIALLYVNVTDRTTQAPLNVQISCVTPGIYLRVAENQNPNDWNVAIEQEPGQNGILPMGQPKIVGSEKYDKQQIAGPSAGYVANTGMLNDGEVASFRFSYDDMQKVPRDKSGNAILSMYLDVDKSANTNIQTKVDVEAVDRAGILKSVSRKDISVNEKILTEVTLPLEDLPKGDDLFVHIRCAVPDHWVSFVNDSVRFELTNSPFLFNLMKSELVLFFSAVLMVTIAVVASIRVNGWVAMLVAGSAYFLGHAIPMLQEFLTNGIESLFSPGEMTKYKDNYFYSALIFLQNFSIKVVYTIANLLPDFRHFDPTKYILQFRNMPALELCGDLGWMVLFAIPLIAVGYLMIRKQELA